jgi:hypothetical protein
VITDAQIRKVQAENAERDASRARQKKAAASPPATFVDGKPMGKTLVEIFSEEEESNDQTDPGTSLMEILSREDADHG